MGRKKKHKRVGYKKKKQNVKEADIEQLIKEHNAKALRDSISGNGPVFFINGFYKVNEGHVKNEQASFYRPYCNEEEINRILNVNSSEDFLLKTRADAVANNPRIERVIIQRQEKLKERWNFTNHFSKEEFNNCYNLLSEDNKLKLSNVPMGFIFTNEPNGACMRTDFGNIIVISETLKYFLFFMNLCFINFDNEKVPPDVVISAATIAIRTMLETESLDFELDPRGIIPEGIEIENNETVKKQLQFIISHEFAHHLLGHLDNNHIVERNLSSSLKPVATQVEYKFYNNTQKQEFEADIEAIKLLQFKNEWNFEEMVQNAIMFFIYLDVYENVKNQIFPPIGYYKTHPDPIDRIWNLYEALKDQVSFDKSLIERALDFAEMIKQYFEKDVAVNIETYETYGSAYLGQWQGKVLVDRIDY